MNIYKNKSNHMRRPLQGLYYEVVIYVCSMQLVGKRDVKNFLFSRFQNFMKIQNKKVKLENTNWKFVLNVLFYF